MRSRLGAYRITPVGIVVFSVLIVGLVVLFFGPRSTEGAAFTIVVAVYKSPAGPILSNYFSATWHTFFYWFTGLFK